MYWQAWIQQVWWQGALGVRGRSPRKIFRTTPFFFWATPIFLKETPFTICISIRPFQFGNTLSQYIHSNRMISRCDFHLCTWSKHSQGLLPRLAHLSPSPHLSLFPSPQPFVQEAPWFSMNFNITRPDQIVLPRRPFYYTVLARKPRRYHITHHNHHNQLGWEYYAIYTGFRLFVTGLRLFMTSFGLPYDRENNVVTGFGLVNKRFQTFLNGSVVQ